MKKVLVIIFSILLVLQLSGCYEENSKYNVKEDISIAINHDVMGFYPWVKSYEINTVLVNRNIYNSLVEFNEIFKINPCLAESWNNPDNLTWRFYLRDDVTFHNGYKFTSEDVKYTFDLIRLNDSENNQFKELLKLVDEVKILDEYSFEVITVSPCPVLLYLFTDIFIVSKQYQEENQSQVPIGTGAYRFINYSENEYINLQRYDTYWRKPLPDIKYASFKVIHDYEECTRALMNGEIDLTKINERFLDDNKSDDFTISRINDPTVVYISFDFREDSNITSYNGKNPFADVRVRKAIYHAIDIDEVLEEYSDLFSKSSQFVIPLINGYNPEIKRLGYNLSEAKKLMKDAGFENGFEVVFDYSYEVFSESTIDCIKRQLSEININLSINSLSYKDFILNLISNNFSIYANCWTTGTGDGGEIYDYLIGTKDDGKDIGLFNAGYYSNYEVDRFGENASICMDNRVRQQFLKDCFKIAMKDVAWIPLFSWKNSYGISKQFDWISRADQQILIEYINVNS